MSHEEIIEKIKQLKKDLKNVKGKRPEIYIIAVRLTGI
jgi:hypothetical protein